MRGHKHIFFLKEEEEKKTSSHDANQQREIRRMEDPVSSLQTDTQKIKLDLAQITDIFNWKLKNL